MATLAELGSIAKADDKSRRRWQIAGGTAAAAGSAGALGGALHQSDRWMRANTMHDVYRGNASHYRSGAKSREREAADYTREADEAAERHMKLGRNPVPEDKYEKTKYYDRLNDAYRDADRARWNSRNARESAAWQHGLSADYMQQADEANMLRRKYKGRTLALLGGSAALGAGAVHQLRRRKER